jgi:D-3-phosphoglycerate dehydrogenase
VVRVLVSDTIAEAGLEILKQASEVDYRPKLSKENLLQIIGEYDALMVRSETRVASEVIEAGSRLKVIGRAGVGVDNIDVQAATRRGILVVNSPEGNTVAAAELTIALLLSLARKIPQADRSMRAGEWRRMQFTGTELYKKTLGVIGLGKIGRETARRARAFEMHVIGYDPYLPVEHIRQLGVESVELESLFSLSDFITLHTPLTAQTRHIINTRSLALMKPGVRIINCARGELVEVDALAGAIESGHVAGAALDVFPQEPPSPDLAILQQPQNVLTPHLGASTEEAQSKVAVDVAEQIVAVLKGNVPHSPVNLPPIPSDLMERVEPYLKLAEKTGRLHMQLLDSPISALSVHFAGEWESLPLDIIARSVLVGLISLTTDEPVNLVNAPLMAQQRGLRIEWSHAGESDLYSTMMSATVRHAAGEQRIAGTVFGRHDLRITHIDDLLVDIVPEGILLVTEHHDRPGIIGRVGTLLGNHQINIAGMHVGRDKVGGRAMMMVKVDDPVSFELMTEISQMEGVGSARLVYF